jgi:cytochrome c oxidase cbb3-type subunit 2
MANETKTSGVSHEKIETNNFLMIVLILLVLLVGGMVEIVPLFFQKSTTEPITGIQPYTPLQLAGRDVYLPLADDPPLPRRDAALWPLLRGG